MFRRFPPFHCALLFRYYIILADLYNGLVCTRLCLCLVVYMENFNYGSILCFFKPDSFSSTRSHMHRKSNMKYSMIPVQGVVIVNESTLVTRLINALSITFVFLQIFGEVRLISNKIQAFYIHHCEVRLFDSRALNFVLGRATILRPAPAKCPAFISKLVCHVMLFKNNSQI